MRSRLQPRLGLSLAVPAALLMLVGVACDDDETQGAADATTSSTTSTVLDSDSGGDLAATADQLCADVSDSLSAMSGLADDISDSQNAGGAERTAQVLAEQVGPVLETLQAVVDLEGEQADGQFQAVFDEIEAGIDTVRQAAEAAQDGNFGQASDLLRSLDDRLADLRRAAMDVDLERCAAAG